MVWGSRPIPDAVVELEIAYAPTVPDPIQEQLEQAARRTGLSLGRLELLGQDLVLAMAYVEAVHAGTHGTFVDTVDWERLERLYRRRRRTPAETVVP